MDKAVPLEHTYFNGGKKSVREIHAFAERRSVNHAGYARRIPLLEGQVARRRKDSRKGLCPTIPLITGVFSP